MSRTGRLALLAVASLGAAVFMVWGLAGLPSFGHYHGVYGHIINARGVAERHATNVVNSIVFDYRGIDTVGEEFILFAAVMGVTLLLRVQRREHEESPEDHSAERKLVDTSDAVRVASLILIGPFVLLGLYVVAHGTLTPGGGFQGGAVLVAAPIMIYLGGRYLQFRSVSPMAALDFGEGAGAGGFVIIGLVGMIVASAFLFNFLPLGQSGNIFSGGMLPLINVSVGLEVAAGVVLVIYEFLEQTLMVRV
jgi:multicomponent Na+:H+ antiporter subunit B